MSQDSKFSIAKATFGVIAVGLGLILIKKFFTSTKTDECNKATEEVKDEAKEEYDTSPYLADKINGNLQLNQGTLELELAEKQVI